MTGLLIIMDEEFIIAVAKNEAGANECIRKQKAVDALKGEKHEYTIKKGRIGTLN